MVGTPNCSGEFRLGRLDHVHVRVPDREAAARWYCDNLGFEPVAEFAFWSEAVEGGPLHLSADGGQTMLALFEASASHPLAPQRTGIAFSSDAQNFVAFARSLPGAIYGMRGEPLAVSDIIDFDLCWAYEFVDPWENRIELNTYAYDTVRSVLIEAEEINPVRYWPAEALSQWRANQAAN